jgi:hypothetical protein
MEPEGSLTCSQQPAIGPCSKSNPVHTVPPYFLVMHLNIILICTPGSRKWSLSLRFTDQNCMLFSPIPFIHLIPRHGGTPPSWCSLGLNISPGQCDLGGGGSQDNKCRYLPAQRVSYSVDVHLKLILLFILFLTKSVEHTRV